MLVKKIQQVCLTLNLCGLLRKACEVHFLLLPPLARFSYHHLWHQFSVTSAAAELPMVFLLWEVSWHAMYGQARVGGRSVFCKQYRKLATVPCTPPPHTHLRGPPVKNFVNCIRIWSHKSWVWVLLLLSWSSFLMYKVAEMVPSYTIILKYFAWHLEVEILLLTCEFWREKIKNVQWFLNLPFLY